jgi:hypothetical protein
MAGRRLICNNDNKKSKGLQEEEKKTSPLLFIPVNKGLKYKNIKNQ